MLNAVFVVLLLLGPEITAAQPMPVPFEVGLVAKVDHGVFTAVADAALAEAAVEIEGLQLSGETEYKKVKINWWDVGVSDVHFEPTNVHLTQGDNEEILEVHVGIRGSVVVGGRWRAERKVWGVKLTMSGGVNVRMSGFSTSTVISIGRVAGVDERIKFEHLPADCTLSISNLSVDFSGTHINWILDFLAWVFEDEIVDALREGICESISEEADKIATMFQQEIMNGNETINILDMAIQLNNDPWVITGGKTCLIVGFMGDLYWPEVQDTPLQTDPFLPPTTETLVEEEENDITTVQATTSGFTTSSVETSANPGVVTGDPEEVRRRRRDTIDWCSAIPGRGSAVALFITEDMVRRTVKTLHRMQLIDYTVERDRGIRYSQFWGEQRLDNLTIRSPSKFQLERVRITSLLEPVVEITEDRGIRVSSPLRARVTLKKGSTTLRVEVHVIGETTAKTVLEKRGGGYRIIPRITVDANVTQARIKFAERTKRAANMRFNLNDQMERTWAVDFAEQQVDKLIQEELAGLIERELSEGFPINLPPSLEIRNARITYHRGYVSISIQRINFSVSELAENL